jgi:hypothetical protein
MFFHRCFANIFDKKVGALKTYRSATRTTQIQLHQQLSCPVHLNFEYKIQQRNSLTSAFKN